MCRCIWASLQLRSRPLERMTGPPINKGARDNCKIITNFDINDYADELELPASALVRTSLLLLWLVKREPWKTILSPPPPPPRAASLQ